MEKRKVSVVLLYTQYLNSCMHHLTLSFSIVLFFGEGGMEYLDKLTYKTAEYVT